MRRLFWIVLALMTVYSGYWFVGSRGVLAGARAALDQIKAEGRGNYAALSLAGFPSRFDVTVDRPELSSGDGLLHWSAPFLQVLALSYRPNKVIVLWPHEQRLRVGAETLTLRTADMRASIAAGASTDLPLDHATLVATTGALVSQGGASLAFDSLRFATRRSVATVNGHDIGIALDAGRTAGLALPPPFDSAPVAIQADATLGFDRPIDRLTRGLNPISLSIRTTKITWATTVIDATGDLAIAPTGFPEGRITLRARGWQDGLRLFTALGLVRAELAPTLANALTQLEKTSPEAGVLDIPLAFSGGRMSLGPIPLGAAPRFGGYSQ